LTIRVGESRRERNLALAGELDFASIDVLEEALADAMRSRSGRVLIDLSALQFIDSTGMRTLYVALQQAREDGSVLQFVRAPESVMHALELTGLASEFPFTDSDSP
jgi:anti-anti-sigma factor